MKVYYWSPQISKVVFIKATFSSSRTLNIKFVNANIINEHVKN
jgi:hypothetical protein